MSNLTVHDQNRQLARQIDDEVRRNPKSQFAGKFVGIANGQVVSVADDPDDAIRKMLQVESDPAKTICIEAGADYSEVQEIWEAPFGNSGQFGIEI